jgi:type IX secretion system PorP/SprF family membrane protein
MRRILQGTLLLLLATFSEKTVQAQVDPHFSQYYVYPSWLNPALTGSFDGNYRVSGIYRSQWGHITSPFQTTGLSADFTTEKNLNYGVSLLHQKAGNGGYQYTTAYANVAYTGVKFGAGDFQRITFGFQGGLIQRRFDRIKMTFGDQWNPVTGYNPGNATADVLTRTSASSFDLGAGALYFDAQPGKKANLYAGFSASHITQPDDQFSATGTAKLPVRWTAHAGVRLALSDDLSITPNALYLRQGTAEEKMIGAYAQIKATSVDLLAGVNYRFKDAIAPYVGFTFRNMVLGASYDVNTSDLGKLVRGSNSFEISLSFIGKKKAKTPEVEFICPVL